MKPIGDASPVEALLEKWLGHSAFFCDRCSLYASVKRPAAGTDVGRLRGHMSLVERLIMSFVERVVRKWVVVCDNCGYEDAAVAGGGDYYAPRGWTELRSGGHACSGACRWMIEERSRVEPEALDAGDVAQDRA